MGKSKTMVSEKAAIQLLGRLFTNPGSDELTLEQAYEAAGRGDRDPETNRNWLNTVIVKLRQHSLISTIDKYENSRTKLDKLRITAVGRNALGWPSNNFMPANVGYVSVPTKPQAMSSTDLAKAIAVFRNENPDFDVVFEVKLKEQPIKQN